VERGGSSGTSPALRRSSGGSRKNARAARHSGWRPTARRSGCAGPARGVSDFVRLPDEAVKQGPVVRHARPESPADAAFAQGAGARCRAAAGPSGTGFRKQAFG